MNLLYGHEFNGSTVILVEMKSNKGVNALLILLIIQTQG